MKPVGLTSSRDGFTFADLYDFKRREGTHQSDRASKRSARKQMKKYARYLKRSEHNNWRNNMKKV